MKKEVIFSSILSTTIIILVIMSLSVFSALGNNVTTFNFSVNLTIGNADPTISWVETGITANPLESSTRTVYFQFNATDTNGYSDINYSSAQVVVTLAGEQTRASTLGNCVAYQNTSDTMWLNCSVDLYYYDMDGSWTINASVKDNAGTIVNDTSETFAYGQLQAVRSTVVGITFGSVNLGDYTGASNDPMYLNNTGNQNFTEINLTAYDLFGSITASEYIPASNFSVNATGDGWADTLANQTMVKISSATLARDVAGVDTNVTLYFHVKVPSAGLSTQDYISGTDWQIEVFP